MHVVNVCIQVSVCVWFTSDCEVEAHCSVANGIARKTLIQSPSILQLWLVNVDCQIVL